MCILRGQHIRLALTAFMAGSLANPAHAFAASHELEDSIATVMSWVVLIVVPVIGIGLFLLVHVLPERIAARRHHPQKDAIHMLCMLSLVFGGLLWPLAWLWAYTRPTSYVRAYGTDKHDDYFVEMAGRAEAGELAAEEAEHLETQLASIDAAGQLHPELKRARAKIGQAFARHKAPAPGSGAA